MIYDPALITTAICILIIALLAGTSHFGQKRNSLWNRLLIKLKNMLLRLAKQVDELAQLSSRKKSTDSQQITETMIVGSKNDAVEVQVSTDLPPGTSLQVALTAVDAKGKSHTQTKKLTYKTPPASKTVSDGTADQANTGQPVGEFGQFLARIRKIGLMRAIRWRLEPAHVGWVFFMSAILIYALIISFRIDQFPIYFFTDEAIHMNLASDFIRDHFRNYSHEFLPTFFIVEGWVNGTSVYVQLLPYLLFGKTIIATRLVSAFITLLASVALALLLKQVFKIKYYWAGIFLLLTTPAWFFHARTAFEYAEVASFYVIFLYFYGRYRDGHLSSLYIAMVAGALSFYTHGLGQVLMTVTGATLFIVDFRYHLHPDRRKTLITALLLGVLLLLPFARYFLAHSGEAASQIKRRDSYWYHDELTIAQKIGQQISQYLGGLNPLYWYSHMLIDTSGHFVKQFANGWTLNLPFGLNRVDLDRHVMKGYGNGLWYTLPFALIGFIRALRGWREFPNRIVLISFLAAPLPASIVAIGMPRMLWMSIPIALLTTMGLSACLEFLESSWKKLSAWIPWVTFTALACLSFLMLRDALVNGPLWFDDYGLYGMQYGAKQVFAETIVPELQKNADRRFVVSPSWANGTDKFMDFFIPKDMLSRVNFGQPTDHLDDPSWYTPNVRYIVPYNEYNNLVKNPKVTNIVVDEIIPYPDGNPGFYVLSLQPADNIVELLEAERIKNITPVQDNVQINGQMVSVMHSPFDSGGLIHIFDDDPDTLARVLVANPFVFDIQPPSPLDTHSVTIQTGSLPDFTVTISLYAPGSETPEVYQNTYQGLPADPLVTISFDKGPTRSARIYIEIKDNISGESSQIHVRTIQFK